MSPDENRDADASQSTPGSDARSSSGASSSNSATAWWVAIGVLAVIAIGLYAWKVVAVNQADDRLEEARAEWRAESQEALEERTRTLLRLSAEPLGLAVRDAAMEENYGTVGSYLDRVARTEGVRGVVLSVGDTVRVATDETHIGRALADVMPGGLAGGSEVQIDVAEDGTYRVGVPITGLNERIGTLVMTWVAPATAIEGEGAAPADTTAVE